MILPKSATQRKKIDQYSEFCKIALANDDEKALRGFLDHVLNEKITPQSISRPVMSFFAEKLGDMPSDAKIQNVADYALNLIEPRSSAFEQHIFQIRMHLSEVFQNEEDFSGAAKVLMKIPLDSVQDPIQRLELIVKICQLHLEEEDNVSASSYLTKASQISVEGLEKKNPKLQLKLTMCYSKNYDLKRDFLKAASKYYSLSQLVGDKEKSAVLTAAIKCAILAPAGPIRSRLLATLYKDERSQKTQCFSILEKMFFGQIIRKPEVETFKEILQPHQMAKLSGGSTVLERAVIEHNILAASNIYNNIYFAELGTLLSVTPENAESTCARMMIENRLNGHIDQVKKLIVFQDATEELNTWDSHINSLCNDVNRIVDGILKKYPEFAD